MTLGHLKRRTLLGLAAALAAGTLAAAPASAADIESIHFLIPGGAGGGWDGTARGTGEALTKARIVGTASYENMSGGGGGKAIAHLIETAKKQQNTLMVNSTPIVIRSLQKVFPQSFRDLTPVAGIIGDYAALATTTGGGTVSKEYIEQLRERYGLDQPFWIQYWRWVKGFPKGDFGIAMSLQGTPVADLPENCRDFAPTPAELFARLDEWGHEAIVIPHGTTWGFYTPLGSSWDMQLRGEQHDPEYVKLNPEHVVPTLVHDGRVLVESSLIVKYLDDAFPSPPMRPAGSNICSPTEDVT